MIQLFTIFAAILAIFFVVLIHEMGHLLAAKAVGVKVERFSIGFGKVLCSFRGGETEYAISLLPLGGYVKMLGEDLGPIPESEQHRAYNRKSVYARMLIVVAGPLTNFLLALVIFWAIFLPGVSQVKPIVGKVTANSIAEKAGLSSGDQILQIDETKTPSWQQVFMVLVTKMGEHGNLKFIVQKKAAPIRTHFLDLKNWQVDAKNPDFFGSLGIAPYFPKIPPILTGVQNASPAQIAGLKAGDQILKINGKSVDDWLEIVNKIQNFPNQKIQLTIKRGNQILEFSFLSGARLVSGKQQGFIGAIVKFPPLPPELLDVKHYNVLTAWGPAWEQTYRLTVFHGLVLYKIFAGDISPKTLGGPISVFRMAGQASQGGWIVYLGFTAFISLALGFVNLLPIPGLDGGHFFFLLIEALRGRPLPEPVQMALFKFGIFLLLLLIVYASMNDLLRIFA